MGDPLETAPGSAASERARARLRGAVGEPLFLADWLRPVFLHYEIAADVLQPEIPFELDLREGKAYVSLVAFTMNRMRPRIGGRLSAWLLRPISSNHFLNVRTYVRHRGEQGIYFIREWLDNRLSVRMGPLTFGLPYRFGKLEYREERVGPIATLSGVVTEAPGGPSLEYRATLMEQPEFCEAGSVDEFLIERYVAFTSHRRTRRFFRVWHPPWLQTRLDAVICRDTLLTQTWDWFRSATFVGAHYSPGVRDVWMGRPHQIF
jgi:uncharacterized protein YqjF (DUF2071 family)